MAPDGPVQVTAVLKERGVAEEKIGRWVKGRLPIPDPVLSEPLAWGGLG